MSLQRHRSRSVATLRRAGAAAVEMAVVAPLVLLLALAATDFGRVVHAYCVVSNAARSAAEYGGMHAFTSYTRDSWETAVRQAAEDEMNGLGGYQSQNLQFDVVTTTDGDGLYRVAVSLTYPFSTTVAWPGLPAQVVLGHRVEMRRIQ